MKKKLTAMLLALAMLTAMLPVTTYAADIITVSSVNINCDISSLGLYPTATEWNVNQNIVSKAKTNSEGVTINKNNSGLCYKVTDYEYNGIGDGSNLINETRNYYMAVQFALASETEYDWPDGLKRLADSEPSRYIPISNMIDFHVYLNGREYTGDGYVWLKPSNMVQIGIPISSDITSITLNPVSFTYDGKEKKPAVVSAKLKNGSVVNSGMYTVAYVDKNGNAVSPKMPGTYYVKLTGSGIYGTGRKAYTIKKLANPMVVKRKKKTLKGKASVLKKKNVTIKASKYISVKKAKGTVSFKLEKVTKARFKKYFKVDSKTGKLTIKKGLKKGSYKLKISVAASGTSIYASKKTTIKITVKVI